MEAIPKPSCKPYPKTLSSFQSSPAVAAWPAEGQFATRVEHLGNHQQRESRYLPPPYDMPLHREAQYVTTLVKALSQRYPQSVYYTMRAFLLERREQPDRGVSSNADSNKLPKAISVRLPGGGTVSVTSFSALPFSVLVKKFSVLCVRCGREIEVCCSVVYSRTPSPLSLWSDRCSVHADSSHCFRFAIPSPLLRQILQTVCPAGTLKKHARQLQAGEIQALPPPGVDGAGPAVAPTGAGAAAIADELMSQLRRAHCALVRCCSCRRRSDARLDEPKWLFGCF